MKHEDHGIRNISTLIGFKNLNNTRDLGGIRTKDGSRIKNGRLIRSGQLFFADPQDIVRLEKMDIRRIFDFRSSRERAEKPDPEIGTADNIHVPIIRDITAGISRDQKSDQMAFDMVLKQVADDSDFGIRYMMDTYLQMIRDDYAVSQYAGFLKAVCETPEGAVLWHCTAGKDRAGFASVLLQEILGVHRDDILEDYLYTNECLEQEIELIIQMISQKLQLNHAENAVREFFGARKEYIMRLYQDTEERYGGMESFIQQALGVDDRMKQQMRDAYLE